MEKALYIKRIVEAANELLKYEKFLNDLGGSLEELSWDYVVPESVADYLAEHEAELDGLDTALGQLRWALPAALKDLTSQAKKVSIDLFDLSRDINHIKDMSSEDLLAIRSIMGHVKLLRDALIFAKP